MAWFKILGVECTVGPTEGRQQKGRFKRATVPSYCPFPCPDQTLVQSPGRTSASSQLLSLLYGLPGASARAQGKFPRKRMSPSCTAAGSHLLSFNLLSEEGAGQRRALCVFVHPLRRVRPVSTQHPGCRWPNCAILLQPIPFSCPHPLTPAVVSSWKRDVLRNNSPCACKGLPHTKFQFSLSQSNIGLCSAAAITMENVPSNKAEGS